MTRQLAQDLWNARLTGEKLPREAVAVDSEAEAYAIQADIIELSGRSVVGWKIGATAEAMFSALGVSQPFLGPLFSTYVHDSGATVPCAEGQGLETELSLRIGTDLPARKTPYSRDEIAAALSGVVPSFEFVGVRFEGGPLGSGYRIVADCGANIGTVLGADCQDWSGIDFTDFTATLRKNGEETASGSTSIMLWEHIFDAPSWLLQQPALAERGLRAGDVVMTGTLTGITPVAPGDTLEADFGPLGSVSVTLK